MPLNDSQNPYPLSKKYALNLQYGLRSAFNRSHQTLSRSLSSTKRLGGHTKLKVSLYQTIPPLYLVLFVPVLVVVESHQMTFDHGVVFCGDGVFVVVAAGHGTISQIPSNVWEVAWHTAAAAAATARRQDGMFRWLHSSISNRSFVVSTTFTFPRVEVKSSVRYFLQIEQ